LSELETLILLGKRGHVVGIEPPIFLRGVKLLAIGAQLVLGNLLPGGSS
jgi:hypothetical protein